MKTFRVMVVFMRVDLKKTPRIKATHGWSEKKVEKNIDFIIKNGPYQS